MREPDLSSTLRRYGVALVSVAAAAMLRLLLGPLLGASFPFATLFLAVLVSARYGGFGPALLATALGAIAAVGLLLPVQYGLTGTGLENAAGLLLYLAVSLSIAFVGRTMRRSQQRAEAASRTASREHEQLRVTLKSIGDAVIATDMRGCVTSMNSVAEDLTGWRALEAQGRPLDEIFRILNEKTREAAESPVHRVLDEGRVVGLANHTVLIARDGTERPIDDSAAPIRDGQGDLIGVVLVFRDVTERRRTDELLRLGEQDLNDFFENANIGLHWVGPDGIILRANQAELELLGYRREDYIGRHIAEFHVDRRVIDDILSRLAGGETLQRYPARLRCADGSIRDVLINSSVLWKDGRFVHTRCFTLDVTGLKRAEEAQALLAAAVESSQDAIITKTLEGIITSWNHGAERLFEYTAAEIVGQSITTIIPPERLEEERDILDRLRRRERVEHFETVRISKSGRRIEISLTVSPVLDRTGRIIGASKVARDITETKRAQERLRTLAAVVEQSSDFIGICSPDMMPVFVNEAGRRMVGLDSMEEVRRRPVLDFFWPEDREYIERVAVPALLRDGHWRGEVRFRNFKTNEPIHSLWNVTTIRDDAGRPTAYATVSPNLNAFKAAEASLRESEERFRALADNISQLAWMADATGSILWYNRRWFDYTGTTFEEVQGWGWAKVLHPDHLDRVIPRVKHSIQTGEVWQDIFRLRGKDGTYRWFMSSGVPIRDEHGTVQRWFGTNTDITEQRHAEEALREADRRKDEFLATLAHELRNPLAPVRSSLEIMKVGNLDPSGIEQARMTIDRQMSHLERLVDDLLDVSRITRDKLELRPARVELASVVHQAVEACRPLAEQAGHELNLDLPQEPIHLTADPVRLAQVVSNLLNNAYKYTDRGGTVWLRVRRDGSDVEISVRDSGIGIPSEMLPRVFDMFTQVEGSVERQRGGLGIGLTLVRRLVEMHGGHVQAFSDGAMRGSEFVVRLPVLDAAPATEPLHPASSEPTGPQRRILVVDDNRDAADSLAMLLEIHGHETRLAYDGQEAVEIASAYRPNVIFLDIGLPKLSGHDVARRIREQTWGKHTVLVALTGWGQDQDRRESMEVGFDHHLVKPVDLTAITELLAALPVTESPGDAPT